MGSPSRIPDLSELNDSLSELRKLQRTDLQHCLQNFHGPKHLILDPSLIPSMDRIAGMQFLRENGVQKVHKLNPKQLEIQSDCDMHMYIIR